MKPIGNLASHPVFPREVELEPKPTIDPIANAKRSKPRRDQKFLTIHISPEASKQLRILAVQEEATMQALGEEMVNDLFAKYGLTRIA